MLPTVGKLAALISVALMLRHSSAQSVTLYGVSKDPTGLPSQSFSVAGGVSVSVGGTNSDGGITYIEIIADTSIIIFEESKTITFLSVPTTTTATIIEDASGFRESVEVTGVSGTWETDEHTCGFGSDGRGTCVESLTGPSLTEIRTVSGSVVPVYTLPATQPSAAQGREAVRGGFKPWIVAAAVVMALFYP
ncbi:hypothetical protein MVEN_01626900 [Mycena venus]|uniref:Uncharacterized protein n=1 Tax=Mycena venus TaxID=2733690 RepID=A0A8H7CQL8_9AGAR|nr:hypothetical protein MVEN_01626900 [Mycena venus]